MFNSIKVMFVALALALATGCASIVSDSSYAVNITSTPANAEFKIVDSKGVVVYTGRTPSVVNLNSSAGFFKSEKYQVVFSKPGHDDRIVSLRASLDGWYFGNILIGGLIGLLVIDPATGAMWKLPEGIATDLSNRHNADAGNDGQFTVALLDHISTEQRAQLVPLN